MKTILSLVTVSLLACGGASQGPPAAGTNDVETTTVTSQKKADTRIVNQLASARCDQEQTCNNIGRDSKFASRDVCLDTLRGSIGNDLNTYQCPGGLDADAVNHCMAAIQTEACSHPFDTLARYDACRTGALCIKK